MALEEECCSCKEPGSEPGHNPHRILAKEEEEEEGVGENCEHSRLEGQVENRAFVVLGLLLLVLVDQEDKHGQLLSSVKGKRADLFLAYALDQRSNCADLFLAHAQAGYHSPLCSPAPILEKNHSCWIAVSVEQTACC
jgi:hypothetical protein